MANEAFGKFHDRNGFFDISIIFVPVVMEGNKVTVVFINPESGDHGTPKITSDVLVGSITDSSIIPTMMDSMMTSVGSTVAMMLER